MKKSERVVELFLDSGAYSAWSQGKTIDIQQYIQFIKDHQDVIDIYANLDVIGDPAATWENQLIMEKVGLHPLPVFHYGEDEQWLEQILGRGYPYIGLGGMVPIPTIKLFHWLNNLFTNYLTDSNGMPIVKVHGFGMTKVKLMILYPFYSVDSTSWVLNARLGYIFVPQFRQGKWIYDKPAHKISVSNRNPNQKKLGKHFNTLNPLEKKLVLKYVQEKGYEIGISDFRLVDQTHKLGSNEKWVDNKPKNKNAQRMLEVIIEPGITNTNDLRDEMNIQYFIDLEANLPEWPWAFKPSRTFI
ncbi:MAG: hypothetical protein RBT15_10050 [Gudongella sp.]|jgi:hypothetical protein|nr:hypothetical protein [Gudongella sp.]